MRQARERDQAENEPTGSTSGSTRRRWTTAERTTLVVSILVILGLIALAIIEAVNRPAEEAPVIDVQIEAGQAEARDELFAVPFTVTNTGGSGASEVTIRFEVLAREGDVVDSVTITLDVLPVRGVEEGELLITHDPATHTVTGRAESYMLP